MKYLFALFLLISLGSCGTNNHVVEAQNRLESSTAASTYAATITSEELKEHLYIVASDEFEGRMTGEPGQKKASEYVANFYKSASIASPLGGDDYFQEIPTEHLRSNLKPSENVVAYIEGTEKAEELIVISAHIDHLGMRGTDIYNGADDDGSGIVAIMEIAEAFKEAEKGGHAPKRSILFLHVTGEERGLLGSKYYTNFPIFPLENTVSNLNIDMIGRVDDVHRNNENYIYIIGDDKLSTELHEISEAVNETYTKLNLDYTYNADDDPNRFYYRSDHYNFAKNDIPVIFYFNGTHQDYHRSSDTPDKIDYDLLELRTKLIFHTAWELANRKERIKLD